MIRQLAFLSTPSVRRATVLHYDQRRDHFISIHALREEGDGEISWWDHVTDTFLSTPSVRRATPPRRICSAAYRLFLSTPSVRRATSCGFVCNSNCSISIHALREEGDSKNREKTLCFCLIIHLPAQIAKRCLQTKPQNHTVTCANGWFSGAKCPGKTCVLPIRTGRTSKD